MTMTRAFCGAALVLLVGCDNGGSVPTALKSGGGILASAVAATVSAKGVGVAPGGSCDNIAGICNNGGRGVTFYFAFAGVNSGTDPVTVTGTWTASDPLTGVKLQFTSGTPLLFVSGHALGIGDGTCNITTPDGTTQSGPCFLCAFDGAPNGAVDELFLSGQAANGSIQASSSLTTSPCGGSVGLASGNINID